MKKKIIYLSFILVLVIFVITLSSIYKSKDNKYNKEYNTISKGIAIMIKEEGATDYVQSNSKDIPKGNYVLNRDKSYCKNNGKIGNYDSSLGKVSFSFIGTDSCYLYFDYKKETIKLGSTELVVNSETPDFSKVATTNEGLFKAQDDLGTSYYFRGAVDNNWVKFGKDSTGKDIYWRIIRINGDGSIRMIYSGTTTPTESTKVVMTGTGTQITVDSTNTFKFNSSYNKAEYVGYQYIEGEQHGYGKCNGTSASCIVNGSTVYNSAIKQAIDNWYKTTTLETDIATKSLVSQDQIFCNDRSVSTSDVTYSPEDYTTLTIWNSTGTQYYYGAYGRLFKSKSPVLTCPTLSDKFTVNISNGNGALTYPVGLITADEVAMAGGQLYSSNNTYYLNTNQYYWLGSPYYFLSSGYAREFDVFSSGDLYDFNVNNTLGARPVISLSSKAKLTGDGTWNNVFEVEQKGYETILANNTVNETTPDFSKATTASEKGLYKADDDYTATTGMKSYYFRGAVDNNWVKFGKDSTGKDIYWRIIRINGDGSIRMIYTGTTAPTSSTATIMTGDDTQISTSKLNGSYNNPIYVGYMYTLDEQHGNSTTSTIKTTIDNWYKMTTLKDNDLVADRLFCNDRSATKSTSSTPGEIGGLSTRSDYYYGTHIRLITNKTPLLTCPTESDKFTVNTSNGNGALTYPVGFITADEVAMAGGVYGQENKTFYLYSNQNYWSMSPRYYYGYDAGANEFYINSAGNLKDSRVDNSYGVRPVISLSSKAKLSGSGTYNDVYTVVTNDSTEDTSSGKSFDTVFAANDTDIFSENGLRYEGKDPKNYICLDNKTGGACSTSSLLFRIIGLFNEEYSTNGTSSSGTKKLLKVIDTNNYGGTDGKKWNSAGTNNWSNASLKTELNGTYLTTLLGTSNVNSKLSSGIANAKWHLGGASSSNYETLTAEGIYTEERNPSAIYSGNPASIYAKVGLMYPSDYGYATVGGTTTNKSSCRVKELYNWGGSSFSDCKNNDWLFTSQSSFVNNAEWLLSPYSSESSYAASLDSSGWVDLNLYGDVVSSKYAVRPTFYLDADALRIVVGDGSSSNPYRIG